MHRTTSLAPNYCYRCGNVASIFRILGDGETEVEVFEPVPSQGRIVPAREVTPYFL